MGKKKVVIYDDDQGLRQEWAERLPGIRSFTEDFEVRTVNNWEFGEGLKALRTRQIDAREGKRVSESGTFFDDTDLLIVDYDLLIDRQTGEEVAYLARCFSACRVIIAVNQFAREGLMFDLTLRGHPESFADLNVLDEQLFEAGLWYFPWDAYRPWYWPILSKAVEEFERRVDEVEENLDQRILDFLQIPPAVREIFPVSALEFVSSEDADAATFRTFVQSSGTALRAKDRPGSERATARIAAARLFKCLERLVLPGQNILVDAAHLLERYPSLFLGDSPLIGWPHTHELLRPSQEIMDVAKIEQFRFTRGAWLSRTTWYWPLVSECESIVEVADPWASREKVVFCEDTSGFMRPDEAAEFVAKVDSPFVRRFVSANKPKYGPKLQFAI